MEAVHSARQLKKIHPECRTCLITDEKEGDFSVFDELVLLDKAEVSHTPIDKVHCVKCPYEEAVFLDSDTWAEGRIDDLFSLLKRFDLALLPETRRGWGYKMPEVPRPFAEFNTGVIAFRNSIETKALFSAWKTSYWNLREAQGLKNDQASFRYVLWHSDLRVAPIPSEYHFLGNSLNFIMWEALLIHGRGNLGEIAANVNRVMGSRVYLPGIGVITGYHGRFDWAKKWFLFILKGLPMLWRKNRSSADLAPAKWWK